MYPQLWIKINSQLIHYAIAYWSMMTLTWIQLILTFALRIMDKMLSQFTIVDKSESTICLSRDKNKFTIVDWMKPQC